jgi:hypothetical protein
MDAASRDKLCLPLPPTPISRAFPVLMFRVIESHANKLHLLFLRREKFVNFPRSKEKKGRVLF